MLYNAIVMPLCHYGDVVYELKQIQLPQNIRARMYLIYDYRTHTQC